MKKITSIQDIDDAVIELSNLAKEIQKQIYTTKGGTGMHITPEYSAMIQALNDWNTRIVSEYKPTRRL